MCLQPDWKLTKEMMESSKEKFYCSKYLTPSLKGILSYGGFSWKQGWNYPAPSKVFYCNAHKPKPIKDKFWAKFDKIMHIKNNTVNECYGPGVLHVTDISISRVENPGSVEVEIDKKDIICFGRNRDIACSRVFMPVKSWRRLKVQQFIEYMKYESKYNPENSIKAIIKLKKIEIEKFPFEIPFIENTPIDIIADWASNDTYPVSNINYKIPSGLPYSSFVNYDVDNMTYTISELYMDKSLPNPSQLDIDFRITIEKPQGRVDLGDYMFDYAVCNDTLVYKVTEKNNLSVQQTKDLGLSNIRPYEKELVR